MLITHRFAKKLSSEKVRVVDQWWRGLTPEERRELRRDPERPGAGERVEVIVRFVAPEEEIPPATDDFYEFIVNHELSFIEPKGFHICTAHAEARAVVRAGRIPASFRCPRGQQDCPMRCLLERAPGQDALLSIERGSR